MWLFYKGSTLIVKGLLWGFTRWEVRGKENVPHSGPFIVASNHLNMTDPPILSASIPRDITFMAKRELLQSFVSRSVVLSFGAFPVNRGKPDRQALRMASKVLGGGGVLGMFPEGTRSRGGGMQAAHPGTSLIALNCDVPILPVGITGTEKISGIVGLLRRPRVSINIGKTFKLARPQAKLTSANMIERTNEIMEHIAEMLPVSYRGVYGGSRPRAKVRLRTSQAATG